MGELGLCRWCNIRPAVELHHCLIHRMKKYPQLDCVENYMPVCRECHAAGKVNGWEARVRWWNTQCVTLGKYHMMAWLESLPLKVKPKFY